MKFLFLLFFWHSFGIEYMINVRSRAHEPRPDPNSAAAQAMR